jgi:hypothetical protein
LIGEAPRWEKGDLDLRYLSRSHVPNDSSNKLSEPSTVDSTMIRFLWLRPPSELYMEGIWVNVFVDGVFELPCVTGDVAAAEESEDVESERMVFEVKVGIIDSVVVCVMESEEGKVLLAVIEVSTKVVSVRTECARVGEPMLLFSGTLTGPGYRAGWASVGTSKLTRHAEIANCVPLMSVNNIERSTYQKEIQVVEVNSFLGLTVEALCGINPVI